MKNSNQIKRIGDICQVIPGAAQSAYSMEAGDASLYLLRGSNLDSEGGIDIEGIEQVTLSVAQNADRYLLREGDVVVMARGSAIRAAFVSKVVAQKKLIASANFIIIRPNLSEVKGEVIVAFLNSVVGSHRLQALSKGAAIQHIPASDLRELEIPLPAMGVQKTISDLFHANREAYQATIALAEQQRRTANAFILNMMLAVA